MRPISEFWHFGLIILYILRNKNGLSTKKFVLFSPEFVTA
jgi:hypothetical protein